MLNDRPSADVSESGKQPKRVAVCVESVHLQLVPEYVIPVGQGIQAVLFLNY